MPIIKKCCWYFSLRVGSLMAAYLGITTAVLDIFWLVYSKYDFCGKVMYLWIFAAVWNIISGMLLLIAVYRNNPNLLPLHLVTCLTGLILQMISHMLIAASGVEDYELVGYAFYAIGLMTADTVIVLSYYQSER